jgi:hypothetical protein
MTLPALIAEVQFAAGVWTDVSGYLRHGISTRRGSNRVQSPIIRYDAGTATIRLDNSDRRFDPAHLAGPYVSGGKSQVTPMRPVRIRAVWNAVTYDIFRGFADKWDVAWIVNPGSGAQGYSETTVPITDGFKVLLNKRRTAVTPVGAGENTGARITRILNSAGWAVGDRVIATGNSALQATTLEGDALSELQGAAESEIGELYIDAAGRLVFRNRQAILTEARSNTVQATFGEPAGSFAPFKARVNTDDATLWNEIIAQRAGGAEQTTGDAASQDEYLTRTFQTTSLILDSDTAVAGYASWILYVSKEPEVRFDTIEIHAHADPANLFPHVLAREIGDRIRIVRQPPGGGSPITRDVFIRGISHATSGATWITTWALQSATKYGSFLVLNNSILGRLDENAIAF